MRALRRHFGPFVCAHWFALAALRYGFCSAKFLWVGCQKTGGRGNGMGKVVCINSSRYSMACGLITDVHKLYSFCARCSRAGLQYLLFLDFLIFASAPKWLDTEHIAISHVRAGWTLCDMNKAGSVQDQKTELICPSAYSNEWEA